jgi:8-oxo-dGTP diphosphatase
MEDQIVKMFGNRLRVRVCGILVEKGKILMVQHKSIGDTGILWAPPGGGMDFGQPVHDNLIREFREETGLEIEILRFLFINEFLKPPLHAIEIFFEVKRAGGRLNTGIDPEMDEKGQIIKKIQFLGSDDLEAIGKNRIHNIFSKISKPTDVLMLKGFFYNGLEAIFN